MFKPFQTRQTIDVLGLDTGTLQLGQILALSIAEPCSQPRGNAVPFQALPPWLQGQIWMEQGARMCSSCQVAILAPKTCFFDFVCLYHLSLFFNIFHISSFTFFGTLLCLFLLLFSRFHLYRKSSLSVFTTLYCPACITTSIDSSCDVFFAQVCALQHMIQACSASYLCLLCLSQYLFSVFTTISNVIYLIYVGSMCSSHFFPCFLESRDVTIFPLFQAWIVDVWCFGGCVWWFCDVSSGIQDGVQVLITHNLRIGVLDIPPPILSRALAGKRHWATQGTQGCLVNFFCRPRRHSEDASQNLQTYKRCGRRNMLDQGHDMVWRTERERALHSEWIVIFFKPWQTSAMQEASSPICPGVYQTLSRGFVNLLLLGLSQILKQITRICKTIPTCRWCHYLGRFFRNGRRTVNCSFSVGAMENDNAKKGKQNRRHRAVGTSARVKHR